MSGRRSGRSRRRLRASDRIRAASTRLPLWAHRDRTAVVPQAGRAGHWRDRIVSAGRVAHVARWRRSPKVRRGPPARITSGNVPHAPSPREHAAPRRPRCRPTLGRDAAARRARGRKACARVSRTRRRCRHDVTLGHWEVRATDRCGNRVNRPETRGVDRIHVFREASGKRRSTRRAPEGGQHGGDLGVGRQKIPEAPVSVPDLHRIALNDIVGGLC